MSNREYSEMVQEYNSKSIDDESIDYDKVLNFLKEKGISSLNNGLSEDENLILFNSPHIPEMISLVLKGLAKIANE